MGMDGETKLAMAMAGRAARACDVCGKERARWYCAADEAYLCEKCDGVVHNANPLSRRHERVRLAPNGAPMKIDRRSSDSATRSRKEEAVEPAAAAATQPAPSRHRHGTWRGYSKKRSRSGRRRSHSLAHLSHLSPTAMPKVEDDSEVKLEPCSPLPEADAPHEVPNFLPDDCQDLPVVCMSSNIFFQDVLSCSSWLNEDDGTAEDDALDFLVPDGNGQQCDALDDAPCLGSTLADIPGDIIDDGTMLLNEITASSGIEILDMCPDGFGLDFSDMHSLRSCGSEAGDVAPCALDTFQGASPFRQFAKAKTELDYEHQTYAQEQQQEYVHVQQNYGQQELEIQQQEEECKPNLFGHLQIPKLELGSFLGCTLDELRKDENRPVPCLRLNYEDVLNAWSERGMSWSDSRCPQTVPEDSNADSAVSSEAGIVPDMDSSMQEAGMGPDEGCTGGGREARVMRYREKRRNRLFSKKIRYEVRKINAERRPRMKGRFVKKTGL